ncbi:phosphotransferase family protein [Streptomyces sp. URMC 128]|uniref:phosphotransferase family protein n=1 Tax=Streptomyces sp. URMC 128 TaxID=3423404 RepID=UPI003F1B2B17
MRHRAGGPYDSGARRARCTAALLPRPASGARRVALRAAASLLRSFHDATRGSRLAGRHPVACHHDPGPNNTAFADDIPAAFIDFDTAAPGDPIEDLG